MMTKKNYLLLAVLISTIPFFISSCSKDDDNDDFSIIGTWNVDKVIETEIENGEVVADEVYYPEGYTFTFNQGGSGVLKEAGEGDEPFDWVLVDDELTLTWLGGPDAGLSSIYKLNIISSRKIEIEYHEIYENFKIIETTVLSRI